MKRHEKAQQGQRKYSRKNTLFRKETTGKAIRGLYQDYPEVLDFVDEFLASYGSTLDELT